MRWWNKKRFLQLDGRMMNSFCNRRTSSFCYVVVEWWKSSAIRWWNFCDGMVGLRTASAMVELRVASAINYPMCILLYVLVSLHTIATYSPLAWMLHTVLSILRMLRFFRQLHPFIHHTMVNGTWTFYWPLLYVCLRGPMILCMCCQVCSCGPYNLSSSFTLWHLHRSQNQWTK